tara:strand:+ start:1385 stop:1894 length:510 start_codon:yes stop_codon:yes gene_type:complete
MIKKLILTAILSTITFSSIANNIKDLSTESSWEDILKTKNIELKGDGIKVGSINTSVFFVEEKDGILYTLKPTKDGFYKRVNYGGDDDRQIWVSQGESIKSGNVTISIPQYDRKRVNSEHDQMIFTGYKDYTQELTRTIEVYEVVRRGGDKNDKERFLFKKEFTVPKKM